MKKKSEVVEDKILYLTKLKEKFGYYPDYIRLDNSGENVKLSEEVKRRVSTQIKFEFVSKNTPQQNGLVERDIATIWGRTRAMMSAARLPTNIRERLWGELFRTAADIINMSASHMDDKTRNEKWENILPDFVKEMHPIGEIEIVYRSKKSAKIDDKGLATMLVGYADQHSKGTFRMWNLTTRKISITRDVTWLNKN